MFQNHLGNRTVLTELHGVTVMQKGTLNPLAINQGPICTPLINDDELVSLEVNRGVMPGNIRVFGGGNHELRSLLAPDSGGSRSHFEFAPLERSRREPESASHEPILLLRVPADLPRPLLLRPPS